MINKAKVKERIQRILTRFPHLNYIQRTVRYLFNKEYVKRVMQIDIERTERDYFLHHEDPRCIYVEHAGNRNPKKTIYIFKENEAIGGFFAQHRRLLLGLAFADNFGMDISVYYGKDYRYWEKKPIDGTTNGFEYYFSQPSGISYTEALVSSNVVFFNNCHLTMLTGGGKYNYYNISNEELVICAEMQRKYIRIKPELDKKLNAEISALLKGKSTLAVHVRGTDFKLGLKDHPMAVSIETEIGAAVLAVKRYGFEQVFVASDEKRAIEMFKEALGDCVLCYDDVFRSESITAVQYQHHDREKHNYMLGVEVLRDMLTMASCDGLIAGLSQVSICARITKLSWGKEYKYYHECQNGFYKEDTKKARETISAYIRDGRIPIEFS